MLLPLSVPIGLISGQYTSTFLDLLSLLPCFIPWEVLLSLICLYAIFATLEMSDVFIADLVFSLEDNVKTVQQYINMQYLHFLDPCMCSCCMALMFNLIRQDKVFLLKLFKVKTFYSPPLCLGQHWSILRDGVILLSVFDSVVMSLPVVRTPYPRWRLLLGTRAKPTNGVHCWRL